MRIAPPIPPTTPPTTALVFGDMELPPPPEPPLARVGSIVAVATSVEETTRELVRTADLTVPSSVKYEVVVKGSVDSRTMFEVMVVLEANVEGSMVLLPITTKGSSSSVTVSTAAVPVRVAERDTDADVTGTDDVMVLPLLSVVVTAVCDVGVLDGDADVPVPDSDSEVSPEVVDSVVGSEVGSEVGSDVGVVWSLVVGVVVGSTIGVVVSVWEADVEGVVGSTLDVVCDVVDSLVVVSDVGVGVVETLVLVVTPVPTTCRLGMTPWGMSWAAMCAKPARAVKRTGVGRMAADI